MTEQHASSIEFFQIPDTDKWDVPMKELHFWSWLEKNDSELHDVRTKVAYLESLGFVKGVHKIKQRDLDLLRHVMNHYAYMKHRNLLGAQA